MAFLEFSRPAKVSFFIFFSMKTWKQLNSRSDGNFKILNFLIFSFFLQRKLQDDNAILNA